MCCIFIQVMLARSFVCSFFHSCWFTLYRKTIQTNDFTESDNELFIPFLIFWHVRRLWAHSNIPNDSQSEREIRMRKKECEKNLSARVKCKNIREKTGKYRRRRNRVFSLSLLYVVVVSCVWFEFSCDEFNRIEAMPPSCLIRWSFDVPCLLVTNGCHSPCTTKATEPNRECGIARAQQRSMCVRSLCVRMCMYVITKR